MSTPSIRRSLAMASVASLAVFTAACGGSESTDTASSGSSPSESANGSSTPTESSSPDSTSSMDPAAENLAGPGCQGYAEKVPDGAGSIGGMAQDPVAVAASNNPLLKTLTATVSGEFNKKVNLVDTLNGGEFTVFAPVDAAFAKLPKSALNTLSKPKNADTLQSVLTYHVVPGRMTPQELSGSYKTAEGEKLKVSGPADSLTVNGDTSVICGGVQTANATVYLIDAVLTPPSAR